MASLPVSVMRRLCWCRYWGTFHGGSACECDAEVVLTQVLGHISRRLCLWVWCRGCVDAGTGAHFTEALPTSVMRRLCWRRYWGTFHGVSAYECDVEVVLMQVLGHISRRLCLRVWCGGCVDAGTGAHFTASLPVSVMRRLCWRRYWGTFHGGSAYPLMETIVLRFKLPLDKSRLFSRLKSNCSTVTSLPVEFT